MRPEDLPEDVRAEAEELVRTGAATPEEIREVLIKMDSLATAEMLGIVTPEAAQRRIHELAFKHRAAQRQRQRLKKDIGDQ